MKKSNLLSILLASATVTLVASCASQPGWQDDVVKIIMLTDVGTIDDKSFNEGTWVGIKDWGNAHGFVEGASSTQNSYSYIRPSKGDTTSYENAIREAYRQGADIVICPGFLFQESFETMTEEFPDMAFVGLDFTQNNIVATKNSINISFKEQESGFLAGYGAVAEGIERLGFMGGIKGPAVQRFGIGFVAGVAYANKALNRNAQIDAGAFWYAGTFEAGPDIQNKAAGLYSGGVQTIFTAAGGAGNSVFEAAKTYKDSVSDAAAKDKIWTIGVDVDQGAQSGNEIVLTSALKGLGAAVSLSLDRIVNEEGNGIRGTYQNDADQNRTGFTPSFDWGGSSQLLGSAQDAVGLPKGNSWRFKNFTEDQYNAIFAQLRETIQIPGNGETDLTDPSVLTNWVNANGTLSNATQIANLLYAAQPA